MPEFAHSPEWGSCEECGRRINATGRSERCADCLGDDRDPTLADFGGGC